jgi:hypothetical protein
MRSKLNEAEASSSQVYSDLQAKLDEKNFIGTSVETTIALMNGTASNATANVTLANVTTSNVTLGGNTITTVVLDSEPLDQEGYNAADHMTFCAGEGGNCVCDGTVYYGKVEPLNWADC